MVGPTSTSFTVRPGCQVPNRALPKGHHSCRPRQFSSFITCEAWSWSLVPTRWSRSTCARVLPAAAVAEPAKAPTSNGGLRTLHPSSQSQKSGTIQVSDGHEIYYKVYGNMAATRVALFVHGGPGAGCYPNHSRFFDSEKWKIVLVDQRGCGSSKPKGDLKGNTTQHLVQDFEVLREELGIDKWMLLGGSWGVTLALAYAQEHPDRVTGLVLRGICLMRKVEIDWMFRGGAAAIFPKAWSSFVGHLDEEGEHEDPLMAYYNRLTSDSASIRAAAGTAWNRWENAVGPRTSTQLQVWDGTSWNSRSQTSSATEKKLKAAGANSSNGPARSRASSGGKGRGVEKSQDRNGPPAGKSPVSGKVGGGMVNAQALLECHYSVNGAFMEDGQLLDGVDKIRHIPCIMVQGRLDFVCPARTAYDLHQAWPEAELRVVPEACHSMYDPAITHELVGAVQRMEDVCNWGPPSPRQKQEQEH